MKEKELRQHTTCSVCSEKILKSGIPIFYTLRIERHIVDLSAIKRQSGLEMMLNSVALAQVMGPDEDMTKSLMEPLELTICNDCDIEPVMIAALVEKHQPEEGEEEEAG